MLLLVVASSPDEAQAESKTATSKIKIPDSPARFVTSIEVSPRTFLMQLKCLGIVRRQRSREPRYCHSDPAVAGEESRINFAWHLRRGGHDSVISENLQKVLRE